MWLSIMIPLPLHLLCFTVIPYMIESLLSAIVTLFNALTLLASYLHIA